MASPAPAPPAPRRGLLWPLLVLLLLVAAGVAVWAVWFRGRPAASDPVAAAHANARGIGHLEQFDDGYPKAVAAFEEAVRLAPDWTPAKINLGIALYNSSQDPAVLDRATELFQEILAGEPDNIYAHHNLGVIYKYRGNPQAAAPHFEAVTRLDPNDPHAWLFLAQCDPNPQESPRAREHYARALALNPYLNAARYGLTTHVATSPDEQARLLAEFNALVQHPWQERTKDLYTEFGRYATAIGKPPAPPPAVGPLPLFQKDETFKVVLAGGARWAGPGDLGEGESGDLWRAVRDRFGGTLVPLDYDGDGRIDLLLLGAVIRNGQLSDLLLHSDGTGTFTDVTEAAGLGGSASLGCAVGDYDNDGRPDLLLTGPAGVRLLRNEGGTRFADVTAEAGFGKLTGVFLGSAWVDIDQDGDLDALVARYADTPAAAVGRLKGKAEGGGGVVVLLNVGEAPPVPPGAEPVPLTTKFRHADDLPALAAAGPATGFVASDLDADKDIDLLPLLDGTALTPVLNDRLLRFRTGDPLHKDAAAWNGGLVFDANGDEQLDLLLIAAGTRPVFLVSTTDAMTTDLGGRFVPGTTDSPPLVQAHVIDLDLDGRADVVGLSADRKPVFLHGDGQGKLTHRPGAFGPFAEGLPRLLAAVGCDLDGDGNMDLVAWSANSGLSVFQGLGNGNRGLRVALTGQRERGAAAEVSVRTNADAVGAKAFVLAGSLWTAAENTTLSAGLGQPRGPLVFGLGRMAAADTVRVRWPDGVPQAELNLPAGGLARIVETDRRGGSCPVLLTWDGERFRYVTDFLGGGALGELGFDGSVRPPRPEESVKIEPGWLVPRDGRYVLKVAEPMDEVMYLDRLRLDVIDHPAGVEVHPDERFSTGGPPPTQELLAFADRFAPVRATDHCGRDVTETLRDRDGRMADGFALRSWLGFAEEHFVELDFGDHLAGLGPDRRVYLVLAGWTDYPYPESILAASQAGVEMAPPVLERQTADGKWEAVAELGFPAGLPKVMTREVPGLAGAKGLRLRIRTNLRVYWDQVYLAPAADALPVATPLPVARAALAHRGFMQEVAPPTGRGPTGYSDERTEAVAVTRWRGRLTRTGDVTPLLAEVDDRFVICGPGDEVTVEFDATGLSAVRPGYVRSFVLRTHGYCKDTAPYTLTGGEVGPLPYRGMADYPAGAADRSKAPAGQDEYDREWNTRPAGGR
jgi:hypothetical protein